MAFIDRVVDHPGRITLTDTGGVVLGTYDVARDEGTVYTEGTLLNATNLNQQTQLDTAVQTKYSALETDTSYQNDMSNALNYIVDIFNMFNKDLAMSNTNWTSGSCTITDSSKYSLFLVSQANSDILVHKNPAGTYVEGCKISGNSANGNYNQYARVFAASVSGDVWTLQWAKQLTHSTSSTYHTSGTTQAITRVVGLIPILGA